jgi:DNA polymerase III subunit delta'
MSLNGIVGNRETIAGLLGEVGRRPSHAYLLAGPRGVGKALVAQGLAQSILCERSPGPEFCCTPENCPTQQISANARPGRSKAPAPPRCDCCAGCVQVALRLHPDLTYLARQANRTEVLIEQVRELIARIGVRPSRGARRVAIIDEAETLNLPAQNALLKTIEEPPGSAIIFMVTASERALLDTVRSRMRPVRFGPLQIGEIASVLGARMKLPPERATALARLARGSLERAFALAEGSDPPVEQLISALARARTLDFADAQSIAQEFFGSREAAAENFELIARILEEMLCFKLLGAELNAPAPEIARSMSELARRLEAATLANLVERALKAAAAVEAMANSRLQAERWWMDTGAMLRGE